MTTETAPDTRTVAGGLARYLVAAVLSRGADAGAAIGLLLLCVQPSSGLHRPLFVGALLAAALTAPHLLGPLLARRLDSAGDSRWLLAAAMVGYGVLLGAAALGLGRLPLAVVVVCVALAGVCGPLLTGGLSSRLSAIVGPDERSRRRGEGWDAVTYGMGGSLGPAAVAAVAAATFPLLALLALAGSAVLAGVVTLTLPRPDGATGEKAEALGTREVLRTIFTLGPLRRVTYATIITALVLGGMSVLAIQLAGVLGLGSTAGATLAAAFGIGNLLGSLVVTARPLRGEPETLTTIFVALVGGCLLLCAAAPNLPLALAAFGLAGAANAPFFAATLAARNDYAPAGGRAQVFVAVAALKVAGGSAGTALAGTLGRVGPRWLFVAGSALISVTAASTIIERRVSRSRG